MKRLFVLRHAKSRWDDPNLGDFDRPLNELGWKSARAMGQELERRGMAFDLVVASPAARVRETIDGLGERLRLDCEIRFEPRLYLADCEGLLEIARDFAETVRSPLIVGHNPGLQHFIVRLARPDCEGLRDAVAKKFPTAMLAELKLSIAQWQELEPACGTIAETVSAKALL